MTAVRLGKNHLRWCDICNLPLLERGDCPVCQNRTREVTVTPPGDVRPAFEYDVTLIKKVVDEQFGPGSGDALIPEERIVLLNKTPALDRMDEVIVDGHVLGALRYDLGRGYVFINRLYGAKRIATAASKGFVVCDPGAVPFIKEGKNLMVPGVLSASPSVKKGDEVIVLADGEAIATGLARMESEEMASAKRGVAVKTKWTKDVNFEIPDASPAWDDVLRANAEVINKRVEEAVSFIHETIRKHDLPAIVSFSGGKDSLATLLLTIDAGLSLPILFVDTGLEFCETVKHVKDVAERHSLELMIESAPTDAFFGNLPRFGPPAKDYRWCCKTNKLGPTVSAIRKNFPNGVLSFIGQRRYESEARMSKPRIWRNPWTPGQIGASPIQEWSALHVWMYLFTKDEDFNPWYRRGLDRIGCFLCPASDMAELEIVANKSQQYERWNEYLRQYRDEHGLPPEWEKYALWRWKKVPPSIKEELESFTGKDLGSMRRIQCSHDNGRLKLHMQKGVSPCVLGFSIEGSFSRDVDLDRLSGLANIMGEVEYNKEDGWLTVDNVTVFAEGVLISKGGDEKTVNQKVKKMYELILRSEECVGCSLCVARCPNGNLELDGGRITLTGKCSQCGKCTDGPCPATSFRDDVFEM
ncbi:MAG: phosphoadenosine phosphosulfate reductase [Candidatus Methanomethylophilaceae archaeon]|nr:phosphoadenosine phosphosulfate reductase [Candidatus Methanomethylophilaceae archaeon]